MGPAFCYFARRLLDGTRLISEKLAQQLHAEGVDPLRLPRFSVLRLHEPESGSLLAAELRGQHPQPPCITKSPGPAHVPDLAALLWRHICDVAGPDLVLENGSLFRAGVPHLTPPPGSSIASVFTIEQIEELHGRLGHAETLAEYVRSLAGIGVVRYDSYISDGHSEYLGHDGHRVISQPAHDQLSVAKDSDREAFLDHLRRHERGETSYLEMSRGLAGSGVEGWTVDTNAMTMTFHNQAGDVLLTEQITPTEES